MATRAETRPSTKAALIITAIAVAGAAGVWAQTQNQPQAAFADSIQVRALEIEAVVMDRDGQRIQGLGKDDFKLMVDGEEVPIDYFAEVRDGNYVQTVEAYPEVVAGKRSPTSYLLFIDEFFVLPNDRDQVLKAIIERIPNMEPGDQVAVTAWDGTELAVLTPWTSSQEEAAAALQAAMNRPAHGLRRETERRQYSVTTRPEDMFRGGGSLMDPSMDQYRLGTQERMYSDLLLHQLQGVVGAASATLRAFPTPPGRKVFMLLAGGWPMDVTSYIARDPSRAVYQRGIPEGAEIYSQIITTANLLGYTAYPVDLPGMKTTTGADASRATSVGAGAIGFTEFTLEQEEHSSLRFIAAETGGLAFINGQRITSLSEVGEDVRSFYWISFSPTWAGDDEFHDIHVEVKNPDLRVRNRAGYADISPQSQIGMAVQTALLYGPFGGQKDFEIEVTEAERAKKKRVDVTVKITVPLGKMTVVETPDGYVAQGVLFVAALDPNGGRSDVPATPIAVVLDSPPGPRDVANYEMKLQLHRKTSRLTVAIYDVPGDKTLVSTLTKEEADQQQS
jgi:VWFA-related protein